MLLFLSQHENLRTYWVGDLKVDGKLSSGSNNRTFEMSSSLWEVALMLLHLNTLNCRETPRSHCRNNGGTERTKQSSQWSTPTCHAWRGFQEFPIEILDHHITLLRWLHPEQERKRERKINGGLLEDNQLFLLQFNVHKRYWGFMKQRADVSHIAADTLNTCPFMCLCTSVLVCVCVCVFSMGFPLLCPCLKAPFILICCVSCPLCLPPFSSAHPITAQWLIACLASKSQCVWLCVWGGREKRR